MPDTKKHQLKVIDLYKRYHKYEAVRSVSLNLCSGEIVGLLGPNGAGKSTVFHMLIGLIKPNKGNVFLNDSNITSLMMHERAQQQIGYLPQEPSVFRKLSVEDNIMVGLEARKKLDKKQKNDKLEKLLDEFQLQAIRKSLGISLSGGEQRRVEVARALTIDPIFILLDEPFAGVDPISIADMQHIIRQLSKQHIGLLITDHNVHETLRICNRAYIMNTGEIIAQGTPKKILNNPQVRKVYLGNSKTSVAAG